MDRLPDEILTEILDYLDPKDLLPLQRVSQRLLKLARDSSLWRYKCFERAPSAAYTQASHPNALSALTLGLGGLSLGEPQSDESRTEHFPVAVTRASRRAKAVAEWDCTSPNEKIDWYSEYVARHAPLTTEWLEIPDGLECRGMALFDNDQKILGPMEDGSLRIWDIKAAYNGRRGFHESARSNEALLFQDFTSSSGPSSIRRSASMGAAVDDTVVDTDRFRAYVAVEDILNEVDLQTLQVVSQQKYAWNITAISQQANDSFPLMIGTSFSLHMHDPRVPLKHLQRSNQVISRVDVKAEDDKMVFLPNYSKQWSERGRLPISPGSEHTFDEGNYSPPRSGLEQFARVEPGPQAIMHRGANEIIIAGRMPSILFYDKRSFPHLQQVIYSGGRLSALTCLPVSPHRSSEHSSGEATLIAGGEYHGRGSLELYELPHYPHDSKPTEFSESQNSSNDDTPPSEGARATFPAMPFSYRNRQAASSAKILSVATQGSRIVFSDGEGALKWLERDGRGLARRWNINSYEFTAQGASLSGEQVVRKMFPLDPSNTNDTNRGTRGDGDLLVWTGEKLGIVTTIAKWEDHDELVKEFEEKMDLNDGKGVDRAEEERQKAEEYSRVMRRALERQADERRWMSRFGMKR